jgi:para-aminobenzoate synthetase component 1
MSQDGDDLGFVVEIPWINPDDLAENIAYNYHQNWVFLYSSLVDFQEYKSYIAIFPEQKYCGDNFEELTNIVQNSKNKMWFGGLNYELCSNFENFNFSNKKYISLPLIFFSSYKLILEFNHKTQKLKAFTKNNEYINLVLNYKKNNKNNLAKIIVDKIYSNFTDSTYIESIKSIKENIANGDFFQANLTRKFYGDLNLAPNNLQSFLFFKELCKVSPANYSSYFAFDNNFIISSSPELFLKKSHDVIMSRPIKGSIQRGKDAIEDENLKNYLQNSPKELAENLMIVDLARNDFGRFCEIDNVKVNKLFSLNSYSTIHHLSSEISGKIAKNFSIFDAIKFCFPPASMTGAPKIKVIETLHEIEKIHRGIYSGALGYIGNDELNLAVVIRTLIISNNKFEFQVGGGITFDSNEEEELDEIYVKAKAIAKILGIENFFRKH